MEKLWAKEEELFSIFVCDWIPKIEFALAEK